MSEIKERHRTKAWAPLRNPLFRALWIATLISNTGTWIQQVANGWLMTTLAPDPVMVSLVEVVTLLPMFLLALPAGALADLVDRRRYLILTQSWMMLASLAMGVLTLWGAMTPSRLLICTFVLAVGAALNSPGWHSVTPEVVSRRTLPGAVALNGLAINLARSLGPALGGVILLWAGPGAAFLLNATSFLAVILVLLAWRRKVVHRHSPPEKFGSALLVGVQHVRYSPWLRAALVRATLFLFSASCLWALLPLVCKQEYGFGPRGYGLMLALFGVGSVTGAVYALPRLRMVWKVDRIVSVGCLAFSLVLVGMATGQNSITAGLVMLLGGLSWLSVLASLHLVVQSSAPPWVQARAISVYLLCFFGGATLGSAVWGWVAKEIGLRPTLLAAAGTLLLSSLFARWVHLESAEQHDLQPCRAWPDPQAQEEPPLDHGPVLVTVEYEIDPDDAPAFREAIERLRAFRYQNGVLSWGVFIDIESPRFYREVYLERTWGDHLRHHDRVTTYEATVAKEVYAFHQGPDMPKVCHLAHCDEAFPESEGGGSRLSNPRGSAPRPINSRDIPLWFIDDFQDFDDDDEGDEDDEDGDKAPDL